jgi:hypothetical protein
MFQLNPNPVDYMNQNEHSEESSNSDKPALESHNLFSFEVIIHLNLGKYELFLKPREKRFRRNFPTKI